MKRLWLTLPLILAACDVAGTPPPSASPADTPARAALTYTNRAPDKAACARATQDLTAAIDAQRWAAMSEAKARFHNFCPRDHVDAVTNELCDAGLVACDEP